MSDHRIVLYTDDYWISPWVFTCFVALHEKLVEFETRPVALQKKEQLEAGYRDRTVTGRVPALVHGDFWLAESSAVVEYLEETFPAPGHVPLLPVDVRERARARQVISWIRSDLQILREERPTTTMFYERADGPLTAEGRAAADKLVRVASALVGERETIFARWSIADADLAFMLQRLVVNGHEIPPSIRSFAAAQWERPSVKAFVKRERPPFVPY